MRLALFAATILGLAACGGEGPLSGGGGVSDLPGGVGGPADADATVPDVTPDGMDPDDVAMVLPDREPRRGGGLLGGLFRGGSGGGGADQVGPDVVMLPGAVGKNCDVGRRQRGTAVARFPENGRAQWTIYDTAPGSTEPRTQYIDGFSDGCLRQVTAALMVFGGADVHETMRYDPGNPVGYSATDTAYETIKGRVCGVRPRAPCPTDRIDRLMKRTAFVTVYPRFGGTGDRVELLLDKGRLVAQADLDG